MAKKPKSWLMGCGIGCGVVILLVSISFGGWIMSMMGPLKSSVAGGDKLEERYGPQEAYVPPADGAVAPERIEAFLAVRAGLAESCVDFQETFGQFARMDRLEEDGGPEPGEVSREVFKTIGSAFRVGPAISRFFDRRNEALHARQMGLGEYSYIYIVAYGSKLRGIDPHDYPQAEGSITNRRVREALRRMLRNQRDLLAAAQTDTPDPFLAILDKEISLLDEDTRRLPWADGLPPAVEAALTPFRERLDEAFCPDSAPFEMLRNRNQGIGVTSE